MSNERSRDFGGAQSRGSVQGGAGGRDPGEEALLELARLIGGQNDPFAPEASKSEPRLSDVTRAAASQTNGFAHRDPDFGNSRMAAPPAPVSAEPPLAPQAGDDFDFPEPSGHAAADGPGYDFGDGGRGGSRRGRGRSSYEPQHDAYGGGGGGYGDDYDEPDDYGDDDSGGRRRRPGRMIMMLLGIAVIGSAAAYGYRTMIASAPSGGPTPIIRADNSPTKITPMSDVKQDSGQANRTGERLVRRDEDPVDVAGSRAADAGASDVVPPDAAPALPGDPRRVHTVPIRADQGTASSPDRPRASTSQPASRRGVAPQSVAAAAPAQQPAPQPAPPQTRQAAVTPPADAPADAPVESGGYVVQLAALRSETDAQTVFQKMQTKYPMLSNRQPMIRRKDRGEQGIFFAALVGPFGTKSDADQLCDQLKAAGGSCFVYKN